MEDIVPQNAIDAVAQHINQRNNKQYGIPIIGDASNSETPQIFEIMPFDQIARPPQAGEAIRVPQLSLGVRIASALRALATTNHRTAVFILRGAGVSGPVGLPRKSS